MKAIVLHQPYATLVALGVKTIETRPSPPNGPMRPDGVRGLPGLAVERGERIAIVAGAKAPTAHLRLGGFEVYPDDYGEPGSNGSYPVWRLLDRRTPGIRPTHTHVMDLGAVVSTAVVADAVPILSGHHDHDAERPFLTVAESGPGLALVMWPDDPRTYTPAEDDQLPFGDFAPGRWAWMLTDVEACAPVPVKGRQGVFALPDDVAEQVTR